MNRISFYFSISALLASSGYAAGVTLINQATVAAAGGFPYVISQSGSYQLSSNLIVSGNVNAINITALNVTLDLDGFTISCSSCNSIGIYDIAQSSTIQNGMITGFGTGAINFTAPLSSQNFFLYAVYGTVQDMTLFQNGYGVYAGDQTNVAVLHSDIQGNNGYGVYGGFHIRVIDSEVSANLSGIVVFNGQVTGCQIFGNDSSGILVGQSATVTNNFIGNHIVVGLGSLGTVTTSVVGYGSNTFAFNTEDVTGGAVFVSMKNNVSSSHTLF